MITNLIIFLAGAVAGAIGMYLIARNSPDHFLKFKNFADKIDAEARTRADELAKSAQVGKVKK